ncbi:hypothetical protein [Cytobacillus sp. IB215665]|uniref:hypothetical protein n=1 Tax=Cytobacillus sp. IB215665 TaxID=3097357 RepID=UPI002A0B309D|nr:hypothetical protein [Cytobacillus sp. IB215665]MDX8366380.1 hypothetical protein [Cytobacillus sp. IB215665]
MKHAKLIKMLVILIIVLSLISSVYGVFSNQGPGQFEFMSVRGETVTVQGNGLYQYDSISIASQAIAQDIVTIVVGIPLLIISLYMSRKGLLKGDILLTGTLGYFLYTYTSYSFLSMYNPFFLIYVLLMSAAFFAFTLAMTSFDLKKLSSSVFDNQFPTKFVGGFLLFIGVAVGLMWLGRIVPALIDNSIPIGLEHYNTLVIQALDLGFLVPISILSGYLVLRKNSFGYLLASIVTVKGITMLTAITGMIISQLLSGVHVSISEIILFPLFNVVIIYCLFLILKNIDEQIKLGHHLYSE